MNRTGYCERVRQEGVAERYLAGRLSASDAEEFEAHYLTCGRCQDEVRLGAMLREGLEGGEEGRRPRRLRFFTIGLAAVLAVGIGLSIVLLQRPAPEVQRLGMVEQPPIYLGVAVRGGSTEADSLFDAAMRHYIAEDFTAAASGLRAALDAGFDPAPARFFLGSSLLVTGQVRPAAAEYRAVIAAGESPYQAEARYYLAKSLLQRGDVDGARAQLRLLEESLEDVGAAARDLLRALEEVERR